MSPSMQHKVFVVFFPLILTLTTTAGDAAIARASDDTAVAVASVAPAEVFAPTETPDAAIAAPRFDVVLGEESTRYRTYGRLRRRAHNVELAAQKLDGIVIAPGAVLSFNDTVGERTREAGFQAAPVIAAGRIRQGLGGGICQVTTTLHIAALEAGFTLVEHRTHSRPSSYVGTGLDATVAFGRIDYKIQNPYSFPVRVVTSAADGELVVRLEGAEASRGGDIEATVLRDLEPRENIVEDASLAAGERVVESEGRTGHVVRLRYRDAAGAQQTLRLAYRAAPRVVRVGAAAASAPIAQPIVVAVALPGV